MAIYKFTAEGDVIFVRAYSLSEAQDKLQRLIGPHPGLHVEYEIVEKLPRGETAL